MHEREYATYLRGCMAIGGQESRVFKAIDRILGDLERLQGLPHLSSGERQFLKRIFEHWSAVRRTAATWPPQIALPMTEAA